MKILVTGGAGFVGSHIVDQLIEQDYEVAILDNLSTGREEHINDKASFYSIDLNSDQLGEVFEQEKPDQVIHQAAQTAVSTSVQEPIFDAENNVLGMINLLEQCRIHQVKKVIYASSAAVYGNPQFLPIHEHHPISPLSGYGVSKYTPEQYLQVYAQLYGLSFTILRYANVYGVRQDPSGEGGVTTIFVNQIIKDLPICIYGDGSQTRDYVYVEDVARANILSLSAGDGGIFNIGTGMSTSIQQLVDYLSQIARKKVNVTFEPERLGDIRHSYFDITRARSLLTWEPQVELTEGLKRTYQYYDNKYRQHTPANSLS